MGTTIKHQVIALPVLGFFLAAVDTVLTRLELRHRPADPSLFLEAGLLWSAIGCALLLPAAATARLLSRRRGPGAAPAGRDALVLLAWMLVPVALHVRLNHYTDLGGDLSRLARPAPWLDAGLTLLFCAGVLWLGARVVRRRRLLPVALGLVGVAFAAGLFLSFTRNESGPGLPNRPNGPNLLLIVWDTTRAPSLELYGYDRSTTPHLAELAETSHVFANARSTSRYTFTSHLSLLTGTYPSHHGARLLRQQLLPQRTPSVVQALREAGYRTGGFTGTGVLRAQTGIGFGFEVWDDAVDPAVCDTHAWALVHDLQSVLAHFGPPFSRNGLPHWIQDFTRPAHAVLGRARAWIERDDPRPWFCMINLYDVHWPYLPPEEARERWVREYDGSVDGFLFRSDQYADGTLLDEVDHRHLTDLYDAEMWQLDRDVAAFLEAVDLDRTAVVVTSDHGEAFGEGGLYEHNDILEAQVRVPLLVRPPGGAPPEARGAARQEPTSGVDVAPTLLALAGLPPQEQHAGFSLIGTQELTAERRVLVEDRDHMNPRDVRLALYEGTWKLVRRGLGDDAVYQLFDLASDPEGLHDIAAGHPDVVADMTLDLEGFRDRWGADDEADAAAGGGDLNQDVLRGLGYTGD